MITTCPPRHADPEFVPSLRLLVQRERYSLLDIGLMFGVSRERVRQWVARYGIEHPDSAGNRGLNCLRCWDDRLNRFLPIPRGVIREEKRRARGDAWRSRLATERKARWNRAVSVLIAERERLGRNDLSQREMAEAIFGRRFEEGEKLWGPLLQSLGRRAETRWGSLRATVARLRREAGLVDRDTRGEYRKGFRATHCKRGHPLTPENVYVYPQGRQCKLCKRLRSKTHPRRPRTPLPERDRHD